MSTKPTPTPTPRLLLLLLPPPSLQKEMLQQKFKPRLEQSQG
jgi:hypothetical protein